MESGWLKSCLVGKRGILIKQSVGIGDEEYLAQLRKLIQRRSYIFDVMSVSLTAENRNSLYGIERLGFLVFLEETQDIELLCDVFGSARGSQKEDIIARVEVDGRRATEDSIDVATEMQLVIPQSGLTGILIYLEDGRNGSS